VGGLSPGPAAIPNLANPSGLGSATTTNAASPSRMGGRSDP
jgi:hypothetical protein